MRHTLIPAVLLATVAMPVIAQSTQYYEPGLPYVIGDITIPSQQTLPPATAPILAFRPSCEQLATVEQAPSADLPQYPSGSTAFGVADPKSQAFLTMSVLPPGLPLVEAHLQLDAEGTCKLNGVTVPIVLASDLPQPVIPEVEADAPAVVPEAAAPQEQLPIPLIVGGVLMLGAGAWLVYLLKNKPDKASQATASTDSPLAQMMSKYGMPGVSSDGGSNDAPSR